MDPFAAELALAETAARQRQVYALARSAMAVPLQLLALAWIALVPVALLVGRNHLGPFVGFALLVVTLMGWTRYRRIAREHGVSARFWPWLAVAVVALAGGAAASRTGTSHHLAWLNIAGPFLVNAVALLALALLIRSRNLAICVAAMIGISVTAAMTMRGDAAVAVQLVLYAVALLVATRRVHR
jgi:hypothetical protein